MTRRKKTTTGSETPPLFIEEGLLRGLLRKVLENILEEEVERFLGAGPYERAPDQRRGYRNGKKPRTLKTAAGKLEFEVPQVREGGFRTQVFERYQRSDKALVSAIQEMVVKGVSTRQVSEIMHEMGGFEVSAATVSRTMAELDAEIEAFFSRPLGGCEYPYIIVDARYEKVRKNGRVVSQAVLIVAGIRDDGQREFLSLGLGDSESEATWGEIFSDLKKRGLSGVELVVSDGHKGIRAAMSKHLQGVGWQRCKVHFMREMLKKTSFKNYKELAADLRSIYTSEEREQCLFVAGEIALKWESRSPKLAKAIREGVEDTLAVWDLESKRRRKLNSTNMMERTMKELKARTRKIGSFPNGRSCWRLIGAVLLEMQDKWDLEDKRYIVMDED